MCSFASSIVLRSTCILEKLAVDLLSEQHLLALGIFGLYTSLRISVEVLNHDRDLLGHDCDFCLNSEWVGRVSVCWQMMTKWVCLLFVVVIGAWACLLSVRVTAFERSESA